MASKNKQTCTCCGKEKRVEDYYASTSPFHKETSKLHVCKDCIWEYVENKEDNLDLIRNTLRMIDKPYLRDLWETSIQEGEKLGRASFKVYMKNLGLRQNRDLNWSDSDKEQDGFVEFDESESNQQINHTVLQKKWGRYNDADLEYLENFYFEYANSYATDTPVQVNLYRNIAKVHLQAEKELSQGNTKAFKDLMELSSKLHNDGNIKPIQSSGANDDKGLSTYGLWIKTIEQDEPCEYFKNKSIYEDFDKFKKYIENWFVRPFKNIFNISKDFNVKDD